MNHYPDGFPHSTEPLESLSLSPIQETFAHNAEVLAANISSAIAEDSLYYTDIEGCPCYKVAIALYVDSSTGRIEGVGSHEKIQRAKAGMPTLDELDTTAEALATGLQAAVLEHPDIVRVYAWHEFGRPIPTESVVSVVRPASWVRNNRVRLSGTYLSHYPLETLIPDGIERGIFLKSIEDHNNTPQSPIRTIASL